MGQILKFLEVVWILYLFCEWFVRWLDMLFICYFGFFNSEILVVNNIMVYCEILLIKNSLFVKFDGVCWVVNVVIGDGLFFVEGYEYCQCWVVVSSKKFFLKFFLIILKSSYIDFFCRVFFYILC